MATVWMRYYKIITLKVHMFMPLEKALGRKSTYI